GQDAVEFLPALRVLGEFCPGNVTRHFGIWAGNKRHWLPPPAAPLGGPAGRVDAAQTYRAREGDVGAARGQRVPVYTPVAVELEPVPEDVKDASTVRPDWQLHVAALGAGEPARLAPRAATLLADLTAHLHVQGSGVRTLRYARTAHGEVRDPRP